MVILLTHLSASVFVWLFGEVEARELSFAVFGYMLTNSFSHYTSRGVPWREEVPDVVAILLPPSSALSPLLNL